MTVLADGTGVVAAGLDHWFERSSGDNSDVDEEEFRIEEWRLQAALGVEGFRAPPDWRWNTYGSIQQLDNLRLTVPFLRFPTWHFCRYCRRLTQLTLDYRELPRCQHCAKPGKKGPSVAQVPFVAVCDYGHLQDFPFREWVHREANPTCFGDLTLRGTGAASLSAQVVTCKGCKKTRNLSRVTEGTPASENRQASSFLSDNLFDAYYGCPGVSAWHGSLAPSSCSQPLRGSLRAAANVYYALTRSAIFLPRAQEVDPKLVELLTTAPLATGIQLLRDNDVPVTVKSVRKHKAAPKLLGPYGDDELARGLAIVANEPVPGDDGTGFSDEWDEAKFREPEYEALIKDYDTPELKIRGNEKAFTGVTSTHLDNLRLVERLRETRALYGFSRINADSAAGMTDRKSLLRRSGSSNDWLPAYVVSGEGLLIRLDSSRLKTWEAREDVSERARRLADLYATARQQRQLRDREVTARFVLLHTLSHMLMNQLTFECGYSSAALRERLFVSKDMAGVLIYTAAGDSEGTMGGLVRMGKPGFFETVVEDALASAEWCSADPICMEAGDSGGQGPDSCNLAACHSCALVPETACEEFNRFLDRGMVRGTRSAPGLGYFADAAAPVP